jgi:phage N-6-adenine-methyltransferase
MNRDAYRTPAELFAALNAEFDFKIDVAASAENTLVGNFIDEGTNALICDWLPDPDNGIGAGHYVWCNPPYSDIMPWVKKASVESRLNGVGVVMLVMADTSVGWYAEAIRSCQEVRFIIGGRISFLDPDTGKPVAGNNKGSKLLIWHPFGRSPLFVSHVWRDDLLAKGRQYLKLKE